MSLIIFLIVLSLLVIVHELGHFIIAKKQGILVEEFGLGYPPRIFGIKIKETVYSLNLIPLGGFVKVYGEDPSEKINPKFKKRSFSEKKPFQRAFVLIGGVLGNFMLAWILISYLFTQGVPTPTNKIIVENVVKNSPAEKQGIKTGDVIKKIIIDKKIYSLKTTNDLIEITKKNLEKPIKLIIERNNKEIVITTIPRRNPPKGEGPLGVVITSFIEKKYPWYQAPLFGLIESLNITKKIIIELLNIIMRLITNREVSVDVSGPIGIAYYTGKIIKFGKNALLELIALLSLNLAIINLLPFPALDGGRLTFVFYEIITKKKPNPKLEKYLNLIGFFILISLAILISFNDIKKILK